MIREAVELKLMQRQNKSQYFEVWVRSTIRPQIRRGSIVERNYMEETKIEVVAGAMAEGLCEDFSDSIDPSEIASLARSAYRDLNKENPRPILGDEQPLG